MTDESHLWSESMLLRKARLYEQRADAEEAGSSLEALWSLMAFEFLARASLARVHPALLADPQGGGDHLLFGFGFGTPKSPRSIAMKTVLLRCQVVIDEFTDADVKEATALLNFRNGELHTGSTVLEELQNSTWMPQFFRLSAVLLRHLGLEMDEFFSEDQAESARQVIADLAQATESDVTERIADRRRRFAEINDPERARLMALGTDSSVAEINWMKVATCPSCGTRSPIRGEVSEFAQPRVGADEIELSAKVLPTGFRCPACELELSDHGEMHYAGLGDQYSVVRTEDPVDFYGIDPLDRVSAEDFFEPDYGND